MLTFAWNYWNCTFCRRSAPWLKPLELSAVRPNRSVILSTKESMAKFIVMVLQSQGYKKLLCVQLSADLYNYLLIQWSWTQFISFRDVVFGSGASSHYLLATTSHYLICWNLLSCSVWWSLEARVSCIASDPCTGLFAVFAVFGSNRRRGKFSKDVHARGIAIGTS